MTKKTTLGLAAMAAALLMAGAAGAKPYVDYTPAKGLWRINAIDVDPNHVDDYLTGLRRTQVPALEIMKAHGIIDDYRFLVREGYGKGQPSVMIQTHYTSAAMLTPDRARDEAIDREIRAKISEADDKAAVVGYEKYRTFIDEGLWGEVTLTK